MPPVLTKAQVDALRAVPLGTLRNRLPIAFAVANRSQVEAAEATGLSAPTVSKLVRGHYSNLEIENARRLATFFGCAIEDLFPDTQQTAVSA